MRRSSIFIASGFLLLTAAIGHATDKTFKGQVTDDMCVRGHMMEGLTDRECIEQCVAAGAKYALLVPDEAKTYVLDKQDDAKPFAGENVVVSGRLSEDGRTIVVTSIERQD